MIKLNNKNITYVALADSSNSLKAPKEIWYADSNNSVKLVYRRKDALIEGEDYEKYHWIKGNERAYIDTLQLFESGDVVKSKVRSVTTPSSNRWKYIYGNDPSDTSATFMLHHNPSNYYVFRPGNSMYKITLGNEYEISHSLTNLIINGTTISSVSQTYTGQSKTVTIFTSQHSSDSNIMFDGLFGYFKLSSKLHLIPCKLLKPVPKWLDANGIRRQVGECGMIDLVSGKFYGNVNSVGTFTVENYYERKEWLVGDGSAYISGITYNLWDNHLVSQVYNINKKYFQFVQSDINNSDRNISMTRNSIYLQIIFRESSQTNTTHIADLNPNDFSGAIDLDYYISDSNFNVKVNGVTYTNATSVYATESKWKSFNGLLIYSEMMSYIREITPSGIYVSNLIPCTLTMDLPASMDANGISRTKGTSGMWDLVSDRFYGNVANSGTFKAVNLAEGVDYEVHQWLAGDEAYFRIPVNIYQESLYIKFHPTSSDSNRTFWEGFYNISSDATIEVRGIIGGSNELGIRFGIRENGAATADVLNARDIDFLDDFTIETQYSEDNKVNFIFNGTSGTATPKIDSRANVDVSVEFRTVWCRFAMVTTDRVNLIPVKLLKSIPAKYDANGIARQAGECGMYDTVNDVFYGNVASSGTFTVSDN